MQTRREAMAAVQRKVAPPTALHILIMLAAAVLAPRLTAAGNKVAAAEFNILSLGDSITAGAVPSANSNHPYTMQLQKALQDKLGGKYSVGITNAGVGGAGIFMSGFNDPITLVPKAQQEIKSAAAAGINYKWVVVMLGINDLLRGGKTADEIMPGIKQIWQMALDKGSNVLAIPPLPAPGFVSKNDPKELERIKLARLIRAAAASWNNGHSQGPKVNVLDLQSGPLNFWSMSESDRNNWLDDGLHLKAAAYDRLGTMIAYEILRVTNSYVAAESGAAPKSKAG
eukprot:jgi/Chrzof1/13327/Cz07g29010.t1